MKHVDEAISSHASDTMAHSSSLFLGGRTGQVSYNDLFTSLHVFSWGSYEALVVASQRFRRRPAAIAILVPHEYRECRSGLAVNGLYHWDEASVKRAPLRSAKCADTAGRLYDGEYHHLHRCSSPNFEQTHDHSVCM